jgi:hypothetical protein
MHGSKTAKNWNREEQYSSGEDRLVGAGYLAKLVTLSLALRSSGDAG